MNNLCYCPVCNKNVEYTIKKIKKTSEDGKFKYYEFLPTCNICNEPLYIDEIVDKNQESYENAYKKTNCIITNKEILDIIDKYSISKRNLSLALGLGELTITRYLDGFIPTLKISNLLKNVLESPELYRNLLIANKDLLKESTYNKTINKVNELLNINLNDSLIFDVSKYIVLNNLETTNLVLQKLLYYTEIFYMALNNKALFNTKCKAWDHGPVYGNIYYEYKNYKGEIINIENININLDSNVKRVVDKVIESFGCYSGKLLSYFTHNEEVWLNSKDSTDQIISKEYMLEFSLKIKNDFKINNIDDISNYSEYCFNKYKNNFGIK